MAADLEEVLIAPDLIERQQLAPQLGNALFRRRLRRHERLAMGLQIMRAIGSSDAAVGTNGLYRECL